jgi:hypothetical protein
MIMDSERNNRGKRQPKELGEIIASYSSGRRLIPRKYTELESLSTQRAKHTVNKWANELNRHFSFFLWRGVVTRVSTQGVVHARQVFYNLSHSTSQPFLLWLLLREGITLWLGHVYISQIARIIGAHKQVQI